MVCIGIWDTIPPFYHLGTSESQFVANWFEFWCVHVFRLLALLCLGWPSFFCWHLFWPLVRLSGCFLPPVHPAPRWRPSGSSPVTWRLASLTTSLCLESCAGCVLWTHQCSVPQCPLVKNWKGKVWWKERFPVFGTGINMDPALSRNKTPMLCGQLFSVQRLVFPLGLWHQQPWRSGRGGGIKGCTYKSTIKGAPLLQDGELWEVSLTSDMVTGCCCAQHTAKHNRKAQ